MHRVREHELKGQIDASLVGGALSFSQIQIMLGSDTKPRDDWCDWKFARARGTRWILVSPGSKRMVAMAEDRGREETSVKHCGWDKTGIFRPNNIKAQATRCSFVIITNGKRMVFNLPRTGFERRERKAKKKRSTTVEIGVKRSMRIAGRKREEWDEKRKEEKNREQTIVNRIYIMFQRIVNITRVYSGCCMLLILINLFCFSASCWKCNYLTFGASSIRFPPLNN